MGVNVTDFGAVGNSVTDDTAAIQSAINSLSGIGGICYVPGSAGFYKTTAPLLLNASPGVVLTGEGYASRIIGDFSGAVLERSSGGIGNLGPYIIERLYVRNKHASGTAIRWRNAVNTRFRDLFILAYRGVIVDACFTTKIENVRATSLAGFPTGSIGILAGGHAVIDTCDVVGFDHGIRAFAPTVNITGNRIEVCRTGICLGRNEQGVGHAVSGSQVAGNRLEACDTMIEVEQAYYCTIGPFSAQGTTNAPCGSSQYGLRVNKSKECTIEAVSLSGGFVEAGVSIGSQAKSTGLKRVISTNALGDAWRLPVDQSQLCFEQCNLPT